MAVNSFLLPIICTIAIANYLATCNYFFFISIECSQIRAVSNNSLLQAINTNNLYPSSGDQDISTEWCFDTYANVNLTFVEPVNLLYTSVYANKQFYGYFSIIIYDSSIDENVIYTNMDHIDVRSV